MDIEQIIECKNGLEAYEIIENQKIDVVFTDIRMPKMDGISLIKKIQSCNHTPKIVVISGYDDFNYAVQLLSHGVKDYLLKPVEREKIFNILVELEKEIHEDSLKVIDKKVIIYQKIKYILMNESMPGEELVLNNTVFKEFFDNQQYIVICTNYKCKDTFLDTKILFFDDINGHKVLIIKSSEKKALIDSYLKEYGIGISSEHSNISEIYGAYQEALADRKNLYLPDCMGICKLDFNKPESVYSEETIEKFIYMKGTTKFNKTLNFVQDIIFETKCGKLDLDEFSRLVGIIIGKIRKTYKSILNEDCTKLDAIENLYTFNNIDEFYESAKSILSEINSMLVDEYDNYKSKSKIQSAIVYIHENYKKDLNMAVVSNHISMNYSLFSSAFKQYTNQNFVEYLKSIRMKEAKKILEQTDKKIIEISQMVGYNNEKHFMKIFRKTFGVTPSEYRKNIQRANCTLKDNDDTIKEIL